PGVIESINNAEIIVICPSNPIISIGPILEIKGIREALINSDATKVAVSPLVGGKPLKGPADRLMKGLNLEVSSTQIAKLYADFLDIMVIDNEDRGESQSIENLGVKTIVTDTIMSDDKKSEVLSQNILDSISQKV
ncbi:MAG: 2-phospho-L-lactate transferase, partial [Candidatus Dadabacteria bacterium]|nr:2-phospho-L-lactate transferase [Candidatus Dadabacteria bacterium]NIQ15575.1 2-phospho-L-lactate transferase [Candidatus Dadabacteria bacterium]